MTTNKFHKYAVAYNEPYVWDHIKTLSYFNNGMFYIKDAANTITSDGNEFYYNYVANKGGVFYLENSFLSD